MVTAIIGRQFLTQYNQQYGSGLSAKAFFETVCFPLFYGHPKYLQWVGNSPFVQMKKGQKPHLLTPAERIEKLANLAQKIEEGDVDASTAIGYPASEASEFATTSGQVTDLAMANDEDTVYCSWIGGGFGVGVAGGQILLFDHPLILKTLFAGWQHYRDFLNDPAYDNLPGNKINSWNGQWLSHAFSDDYREHSPLREFTGKAFISEPNKDIEIKPQSWLAVLLGIASQLPLDSLTGYIYKMGQTNSTYGFIPFQLGQLQRPEQIYVKLFGDGPYQRDKAIIRTLYGSAQSIQRICQMGAVGVSALEPKGLRELIPSGRGEAKNFKYDSGNADNQITFNTYITWLLAMLNNDEFWDEAGRAANLFLRYEQGAGKLKSDRGNQVEKARNAVGKRQFLDGLVPIMETANVDLLADFEAFAEKIHKLPNDNFPYFQTLIRLRYARQARETGSPDLFTNN